MPILQRQNVNEYKKCVISSLCTKQREAINVLSLFESIDLTKTFKQIKHSGDSTMRLSFSSTFFFQSAKYVYKSFTCFSSSYSSYATKIFKSGKFIIMCSVFRCELSLQVQNKYGNHDITDTLCHFARWDILTLEGSTFDTVIVHTMEYTHK